MSSFDVINYTTTADIATNGTFAVSYPSGRSAGSYTGAWAHKMSAMNADFVAPKDFTVAFGATTATVTYLGTTTIPSGSLIRVQLDQVGTDDGEPEKVVVPDNMARSPVYVMDLGAPATADANGVAESQTVTGAGTAFSLDGALVSNGVAVMDVPRNIVAAWTNTAVLTITGTNVDGNAVVENSASGTSHTGKKAFKTVTSVTTSATITGATVGTGTVLGLPRYVPSAEYVLQEIEAGSPLAKRPQKVFLTGSLLLADDTVGVVQSPVAGTIVSIRTVEVEGGVSSNDATCTFKIGTTAITDGVVTIATSGSAAGVKDSATPTAANVLAVGDAINCVVSNTPGGSKSAHVLIEVDVAAADQLQGTLVAGVTTAATATTGDTRGTYDPLTTPDAQTAEQLVVYLADPGNVGVAQYAG